ncbi:phosphoribosylglycinamide formyltransferase [Candidatus Peregrinibacteria bacterium]|nr:phosphoribosylglycinamide formyltransferase [Candidatus Peregrinibacteria bacterium]
MFKIIVLASTRGTDLQAIIDEMKVGKMPGIELSAVISNKKNCYALKRAKEQGFETHFISQKGKTREEFDKQMAQIIKDKQADLIVLVGYMRILSPWFVREFKNKIINIHPATDIKKYGGAGFFGGNVHEAVLAANEKETGCTIHYVTEDVDTGPIIAQAKVKIEPGETVDTLKDKVQAEEKKLYPEVIRKLANKSL